MSSIRDKMLEVAKVNNLTPTSNFEKIVKAKERFGLCYGCPCDKNNEERFCVSELCLSDIEKNGTCHCHCWQKAN